jgi:glycine/D-amino acid oxidase-like deaminating enzyme
LAKTRHIRVVIIGAGFAGASAAYHLGREGFRDLVVLEKESTYGYHASGRNAALCRQLTEDDVITDLVVEGASFLRKPPEKFSTTPLLSETGSFILARTPGQLDHLEERAKAHSIRHERLSLGEILSRWPRLSGVPAVGGIHVDNDGVIDIHALLRGYVDGARDAGIPFELGTEVRRFHRISGSDQIMVETSRGNISAELVVNATGAWAGEVGWKAGSRDIAFTPFHRHLHITERVPNLDAVAPFVWFLGGADDEFYLRPEGTGYLVSGCDAIETSPQDARVLPGAVNALAQKLTRVCPWIAEFSVVRSWACLRTFTPDGRPVVGIDREVPWLFWIAGLGGHGASASPALGRLAAQGIAQRLEG